MRHHPLLRRFAAAALLLLAPLAPLPAQEGRLLFEAYGAGWSRSGGYGSSIARVGDVNGDGVDDIAVGDPTDVGSAPPGGGLVQVISGRDGGVLRTLRPGANDTSLGRHVSACGDVDGDGTPDVLVAERLDVLLYSGASGAELRRFRIAVQVPEVSGIAGAGDWSGDGVPDVAVLRGGVVTVSSGVNPFQILRVIGTQVTHLVAIPGATPSTQLLAVLDGGTSSLHSATAGVLWSLPGYRSVESAGSDLVGIVAGGTATHLLSATNGALLRSVPGGAQATGGVDLDGDGVHDLAVSDPFAAGGRGVVRAYATTSGALLFEREGQEVGELLGWDLAMHPNAGAAGRAALIVSAYAKFDGSVEAGAVLALARNAPGEIDGAFRPFGQPCNFQNTHLRAGRGLPTIARTYGFRFDNQTTPMGFEVMILGVSNSSWAGVPLPLRLPGVLPCDLYVSLDIVLPAGLNVFQSLVVPNDPTLVGGIFFLQGLSSSGFPVLQTSDAAQLRIGN